MATTPTPGNDAATYGGPGWRPRGESHRAELRSGRAGWARCGVSSEWATLREVLLSWPSDALVEAGRDPDRWLLLEPVDLDRMRRQCEAVAAAYERAGVAVRMFRPASPPPPNFVFMRDVLFMTPEGAVVARMAGSARRGEEPFAAQALAEQGIPILLTMRGRATFEGADALMLDERTLLLGTGARTNDEAAEALSHLLGDMGMETVTVPVPPGAQHLLGVVNFVDAHLAVTRADRLTDELRAVLARREIALLTLPEGDEVARGGAMNFVTLGPRRILMPAGAPNARRSYEAAGIACETIEVGEYLKAAGALGCLTAIIRRDESGA